MYFFLSNLFQIVVQHFCHRGACDIGAFLGQTGIGKIAAGMFAIGKVDIGDDVDNAAIGFLRQTLVLASVASLHVEDGDVESLGADDAQTRIGVAQDKHSIWLYLYHQLVALGDDVAHRLAQVNAHGFHIDVGVGQLEVLEEHAIEVIVVVLTRMCQQAVEVLATLVDDSRKADNLRPCANYN